MCVLPSVLYINTCFQYLHNTIGCRTLFATHLHELADLRLTLDGLVCKAVPAQIDGHALVFPHKVIDGVVTQSYGVHIARLARVPDSVCRRAHALLAELNQRSPPL